MRPPGEHRPLLPAPQSPSLRQENPASGMLGLVGSHVPAGRSGLHATAAGRCFCGTRPLVPPAPPAPVVPAAPVDPAPPADPAAPAPPADPAPPVAPATPHVPPVPPPPEP